MPDDDDAENERAEAPAPHLIVAKTWKGALAGRRRLVPTDRAERCDVRTTVVNAPDVLTVADVGGTETGGASVSDVDVSACDPSTPLAWRCDLAFPWQTTADLGTAMAALGVTRARVAYVVTPDGEVTETILHLDPTAGDARRSMRRFAEACPLRRATVVMRALGPVLVALDFSRGHWTSGERRAIVRAAVARMRFSA